MSQVRAALLASILVATDAEADCRREATAQRAHLEEERRAASIWNGAWAIGFGVAAVGQLALVATETAPIGAFDRDFEEQMYVGAGKATLGVLSRVILPLRISIPAATEDPCVDAAALRRAVATAGKRERRTVWLTLIGGTVVNLAGGAILMMRRNVSTAALSFGTGVPFGPLAAWTQPRGSWKRMRDPAWSFGVDVAGEATMLWIARDLD
jgi:hypothetical protein